jgi:hypothetical protein
MGPTMITEDDDEDKWSLSDKSCHCCTAPIEYADECVLLHLVYIDAKGGSVSLPDAIEKVTGEFTAEPIFFCYGCWDGHAEEVREFEADKPQQRRLCPDPSPMKCCFCDRHFQWGEYAAYAMYGELDVSPRTRTSSFKPAEHEGPAHAELMCLDCLEWVNENLDEDIWPHLWIEGEVACAQKAAT